MSVTGTGESAGLHTTTPYATLLSNREIVGMLASRALSGIGDQAARAVLALFVLTDTSGSALRSALVLAVAYVPSTLGFAFLGSIADRFPRRTVMLVADLSRALLIALLALAVSAEASLWVLLAVLFAAEMFSGPAVASRYAMLPDVSRDKGEYQAAVGLGNTIDQVVQVAGFLLAGAALTLFNAQSALLFDAVTFVLSFMLVVTLVKARPSRDEAGTSARRLVRDFRAGVSTVARTPALRASALLAWVAAGVLVATDAVALPYAQDLGATSVAATALLAATPAGAAMAALFIARLPLALQVRALFPMTMLSTVPLLATAASPGLAATWVLWFVSGLLQGYAVTVMTLVIVLTPEERRGRVSGVVGAGFSLVALGTIVGLGALAEQSSPAAAVVVAGAAGLAGFAVLAVLWPRRDFRRALGASYGSARRML
ncbi:MAG: MFS transporter [Actinomycetota bacterium]|nr:MFS transporter [Actinomycetota bacterium]